jgi:hypothetical protein
MSITGSQLVVGECYTYQGETIYQGQNIGNIYKGTNMGNIYKGTNMGKFLQYKVIGRYYDEDEEYIFENCVIHQGDRLQSKKVFTKNQCSGGARRSKKSGTRKHGSSKRKTRRVKKRTIKRR